MIEVSIPVDKVRALLFGEIKKFNTVVSIPVDKVRASFSMVKVCSLSRFQSPWIRFARRRLLPPVRKGDSFNPRG